MPAAAQFDESAPNTSPTVTEPMICDVAVDVPMQTQQSATLVAEGAVSRRSTGGCKSSTANEPFNREHRTPVDDSVGVGMRLEVLA